MITETELAAAYADVRPLLAQIDRQTAERLEQIEQSKQQMLARVELVDTAAVVGALAHRAVQELRVLLDQVKQAAAVGGLPLGSDWLAAEQILDAVPAAGPGSDLPATTTGGTR
ncbi:hypothetical protein [Streptomyces sp. CA-111067]|uniref:hypothetical protein n=1 Tax=Streptomyces sp. CA-111067 TaxID=3240046 RepID=UPI003D976DE4